MAKKSDKSSVTRKKLKKKLENSVRGLFDHIKEIKENQSAGYYDSLSEEDIKSFNKFMILRVLSMNKNVIDDISKISEYSDSLTNKMFYKLLINKIPKDNRYHKYIKRSQTTPDSKIVRCIMDYYEIGYKDAIAYYNILIQSDSGLAELVSLIESIGYSEEEVEKMFDI